MNRWFQPLSRAHDKFRVKYDTALAIDIFVIVARFPLFLWQKMVPIITAYQRRDHGSRQLTCLGYAILSIVNRLLNITVAKASLLSNRFLMVSLGFTNRYPRYTEWLRTYLWIKYYIIKLCEALFESVILLSIFIFRVSNVANKLVDSDRR